MSEKCPEEKGETDAGETQPAALSVSLGESPPRGSSLLLCPAQWSALLEAAPVSLVVREVSEGIAVSEETDFECEGESEVEEREGERIPRLVFAEDDEIRTPLGGQTPDPDRTYSTAQDLRHYCSETLKNVALELDNPTSPPPPLPLRSSPPADADLSTYQTTGLWSPSVPTSPLITHSSPHIYRYSPHSTPSHSVAHLEVTIEADELPRLPTTPPEQRHQVAWCENRHTSPLLRHSFTLPPSPPHSHTPAHPHTPDLDLRQWPAYKTHSRNVSETPSLPPFHSSSTSSAYHSRNSSLGSQLSSCCFESDSLLNQLTDIDSALAVRTGSHGDLKRFHRRGDTSPCCSDLSLPTHLSSHHLPSPLLLNRVKGLSLSPSLEETLCHCSSTNREYILESLEEKRRASQLKSSEWIKQELEKNKESMVQVKVSSKTKHVVHYNVKCGDIIIWEFATKKRDIGFGVLFEATEVATEQEPLPSSHESIEKKVASILPLFRVGTHAHPTIGYHCAAQDGIYEILFDNTYSRFFAKELFYRITTQSSEPNINYLEQ